MKLTLPSLLIAPPGQTDPRFHHAVTLIFSHDSEYGSLGLCLNKPTLTTVSDLSLDLIDHVPLEFPIYWGGPENTHTLWMLHSTDWSCEGTVEIDDNWALSSSVEMFEHMTQGRVPREFRIFAGHCSWEPGQLAQELQGVEPYTVHDSWLVAPATTPEWAFDQPEDFIWGRATALSAQQAVNQWLA